VQYSGILCLDLDNLGNRILDARRRLEGDNHVLAIFVSPSGTGLKVLVAVSATDPEEHLACFLAAESHFKALGFIPDPVCKDIARLCFASWDPDCWTIALGLRVIPFCLQSSPPICTLHSRPIPYTTEGEDERVLVARARGEAECYLAQIEATAPVLVGLYRQILAPQAELGLHQRNEWLCKAVPFLFRAFSRAISIELAVLHLKAYGGLYSGSESEQRTSFGSLRSGLEKGYLAELSKVELGIYRTLNEPECSAFRICRDLAQLNPDLKFFLACDHLAIRLALPGGVNGWRLLETFKRLKIIEMVKRGSRRTKGHSAPATTYRWALPLSKALSGDLVIPHANQTPLRSS